MDVIRVLHIGKSYPLLGGVETVMYDLCTGLSELGIRSDFLGADSDVHTAETIVVSPLFSVYTVKSLVKKASTFLSPAFIARLRQIKDNYTIIHVHHPDPMAALALYLSGYKGVVVCHWHSDIVRQKLLLKLYAPLQAWLLRRSGAIIATSPNYMQESVYLQPFRNKLYLVPIGIPPIAPVVLDGISRRIKEWANGRKIVFALGRLIYYKGFHILLQAIPFMDKDVAVIIGGGGPLKKEYEELIAQLHIEDRVLLAGRIPDKELSTYFSAADLFCMPSTERSEAFGIVQVEAMAYGKPVVTTKIPCSGVSWVNADGVSGVNVPVGDEKALATAINRIAGDNVLRQTLSAGARKRYESLFTQKRMAEKMLEIYKNL